LTTLRTFIPRVVVALMAVVVIVVVVMVVDANQD
jgi:hypothetical protein